MKDYLWNLPNSCPIVGLFSVYWFLLRIKHWKIILNCIGYCIRYWINLLDSVIWDLFNVEPCSKKKKPNFWSPILSHLIGGARICKLHFLQNDNILLQKYLGAPFLDLWRHTHKHRYTCLNTHIHCFYFKVNSDQEWYNLFEHGSNWSWKWLLLYRSTWNHIVTKFSWVVAQG